MIDHFHKFVIARKKIGGNARAIIVTSSISSAICYKQMFDSYLKEIGSPYCAIVAFSGDHEISGKKINEAVMNGFPSSLIPKKIHEDPYRFLIVAEKFQTGYDEPLLHTMYVDKTLTGSRAVQTLSRLNRAYPKKYDTFVLDFVNDSDSIMEAFSPYYRTTLLSDASDPNQLHDLKADLDSLQVYSWKNVEELASHYVKGHGREQLDIILDACAVNYREHLDKEKKIKFKNRAKAFLRLYNYLSSIVEYKVISWEELSIFLNFLLPKLPPVLEEDLSKGILETIGMESYRAEVKAQMAIDLPDENGNLKGFTVSLGDSKREPKLESLSEIVKEFNELFGKIDWKDPDRIQKMITCEIPQKVASNKAYLNAVKNSDIQNARIEHDKALESVIVDLLSDHTDLFKQFSDNPSFKKWLSNHVFVITYDQVKSGKTLKNICA